MLFIDNVHRDQHKKIRACQGHIATTCCYIYKSFPKRFITLVGGGNS
jgi:hypothetical protein